MVVVNGGESFLGPIFCSAFEIVFALSLSHSHQMQQNLTKTIQIIFFLLKFFFSSSDLTQYKTSSILFLFSSQFLAHCFLLMFFSVFSVFMLRRKEKKKFNQNLNSELVLYYSHRYSHWEEDWLEGNEKTSKTLQRGAVFTSTAFFCLLSDFVILEMKSDGIRIGLQFQSHFASLFHLNSIWSY